MQEIFAYQTLKINFPQNNALMRVDLTDPFGGITYRVAPYEEGTPAPHLPGH